MYHWALQSVAWKGPAEVKTLGKRGPSKEENTRGRTGSFTDQQLFTRRMKVQFFFETVGIKKEIFSPKAVYSSGSWCYRSERLRGKRKKTEGKDRKIQNMVFVS